MGFGAGGDRLLTSRISVIRSAVVRRVRLLLDRWGSRRGCWAEAASAGGSVGCGAMVRTGRAGLFRVLQFGSSAGCRCGVALGERDSTCAAEVGNCASWCPLAVSPGVHAWGLRGAPAVGMGVITRWCFLALSSRHFSLGSAGRVYEGRDGSRAPGYVRTTGR